MFDIGIEEFSELELLHKSLNIVFIIVSLIVGITIIYRYFQIKRFMFFTAGLGWLFISSPWWGVAVNFILAIFFNSVLVPVLYLFIERAFIPVAILCWMYTFSEIIYPDKRKRIVSISAIYCLVWEIFIICALIINPDLIGIPISKYEYKHSLFDIIFVFIAVIIVVITGFLFAGKSFKSEDKKVHWKGRFLLLAFISYSIGAIFGSFLNTIIPMNVITVIFVRTMLISSAIEYYLGFFLPEKIFNWLNRE